MTGQERTKLLLVINSLGAGGTERSTAVVLPLLRDHGVDPAVVLLKHEPIGDEASVRAVGIPVTTLRSTSVAGRVRELRGLMSRTHPDLLHTAIYDADQVGRLAALGTGIPVVSSLVNTPYDPARFLDPNITGWKLRLTQAADAATARIGVTCFHAVSSGVAAANIAALRLRPDRVTVVERGRDLDRLARVDTPAAAALRTELRIGPNDFMILAVGRQEFQKAHDDLVRGFAVFACTAPGAILVIAGRSGHGSAALTDALAALSDPIRDRVRVLGHRDDIAALLAAADAFAMPSRYEGTSGAAIEAMAAGVPVVHSDVAGVIGVLTDGHDALLVPVGDADRLASAFRRLSTDDALRSRLVANGLETVSQRFDLETAAARLADLYRRTASSARRIRRR